MHGFGASAYHWRYNIPELAKRHRVYAVDLLGFGWSTKALVDYQYGEHSSPLQEGGPGRRLWSAQLIFGGILQAVCFCTTCACLFVVSGNCLRVLPGISDRGEL